MSLGSTLQWTMLIACRATTYRVRDVCYHCVALNFNLILLTGRNANYIFKHEKEVICSTEFSESTRLKYGEAKFAMLNQRPIETLTPDLINFTLARFIRVRLEGKKIIFSLKLGKAKDFISQEC